MLRGLTHAQRVAKFGRFKFTPTPTARNPEAIEIDPQWVRQNIALFEVPQIEDISPDDPYGEQWVARFHRLAGHALVQLWQAWEDAGVLDSVLSFNGGYVARYKRGKAGGGPASLSNHAWGTAFDINAKWNPLGQVPAALGDVGCVRELVPLAEEHGFAWGGNFKSRPDGMHFEYVG